MATNLKTCPFCGGTARFAFGESDPEACTGFFGPNYYWVTCTKCKARSGSITHYDEIGYITEKTQRTAATKWNNRT